MVYIPRISFKSGISPSLLAWFPTNGKYSGTQKLLLTRTRIFGNKISGNLPSGVKVWRQTSQDRFRYLTQDSIRLHDVQRDLPMMYDTDADTQHMALKLRKQQKKLQKQAKKAAKEAKKKK